MNNARMTTRTQARGLRSSEGKPLVVALLSSYCFLFGDACTNRGQWRPSSGGVSAEGDAASAWRPKARCGITHLLHQEFKIRGNFFGAKCTARTKQQCIATWGGGGSAAEAPSSTSAVGGVSPGLFDKVRKNPGCALRTAAQTQRGIPRSPALGPWQTPIWSEVCTH
jgi:hypothetical protein